MMHGYGVGALHLPWMLLAAVLVVVPVWRICQRVGYSGWLALLAVVPIANLVLLYFLAFSQWPSERRHGGEVEER